MGNIFGFTWDDKNLLKKTIKNTNNDGYYKFYVDEGISVAFQEDHDIKSIDNEKRKNENYVLFSDGLILDGIGTGNHNIEKSILKGTPGSFVSVLWFPKERRLILVRNGLGSQPLYYFKKEDKLIFSTKLKCIIPFLKKRKINKNVLDSFLTFRFNTYRKHSLLEQIKKLPSNFFLDFKNELKIKGIKTPKSSYSHKNHVYYLTALKHFFESFMKRLLDFEGNLGIFLSGGIDSSFLVALADRFHENIKTYTISLNKGTQGASEVISNMFGTEHNIINRIENPFSYLPKVLENTSAPPFDPTHIPIYKLLEESSECDLILMGNGADEQFGGYEIDVLCDLISRYNNLISSKLFSKFAHLVPPNLFNMFAKPRKGYGSLMKRRISSTFSRSKNPYEVWESMNSVFDYDSRRKLFSFRSPQNYFIPEKMRYGDGNNFLDRILRFEQKTKLESQEIEPVMELSNNFSSLIASPFLNNCILRISNEIPKEYKINRSEKKWMLRELSRKYLPKDISKRKKSHFSPPLKNWLEGESLEICKNILSKDRLSKHGLFEYDYINKIFQERRESSFLANRMLWSLVVFQLWYEMYVENHDFGFRYP
ncbi:MAG: asparagine synthetase B [Candidatus Aenigmatarchaeota archaeon]